MPKIKFYHFKFIILFLLIFFLIGLQNFFWAHWNTAIFHDATYWSETINTTFAYYFTIIFVVYWMVEKFIRTDEDYLDKKQLINDFIQNDLKPSFYLYNDKINRETKIIEWKYKIQTQLRKLDVKAKPFDRKAWKEEDINNEYVIKRMQLLEYLSDEYIQENIDYIDIKYEHIDESTITNGFTAKRNRKYKKKNGLWKITKDNAPKFIFTIFYTSLFRTFVPEFHHMEMEHVYKLLVQLIGLIATIIGTIRYAPSFIDEQIVAPLNNRVTHIKNYIAERG
jgi:hypothetical protein